MNKSQIFKQAHQLTKQAMQAGDSYNVTFACALRQIYQDLQRESAQENSIRRIIELAKAERFTVDIEAQPWATYIDVKRSRYNDYAEIEVTSKGKIIVQSGKGSIQRKIEALN